MKAVAVLLCLFACVSFSLGSFYCPTLFNYYPDANDCTKFYRCSWGKGFQYNCPAGTRWSQKLLTCDHAYNVPCHGYGHGHDVYTPTPDFSADHYGGYGHGSGYGDYNKGYGGYGGYGDGYYGYPSYGGYYGGYGDGYGYGKGYGSGYGGYGDGYGYGYSPYGYNNYYGGYGNNKYYHKK